MKWTHWSESGAPPQHGAVLLEGLPGIGHVGQLVAEHVVASSGGALWADVHGPDFPPQAIVQTGGKARLAGLRLSCVPGDGDAPPLVVLTGDAQPLTPHGQFMVTSDVLERLAPFGIRTLYTLGGTAARGKALRVLGAGTDDRMVERLGQAGAAFEDLGPEGGIIGASGVFLGLGAVRGLDGGCLVGESDGTLVDVKAATNVLGVLGNLLGRSFPEEGLDATAQRIHDQMQFLDEVRYFATPTDADQHYIG